MPSLKIVLATTAVVGGLLTAGTVNAALAAGPPAGVNYTATDSFVLKADQPSVTCYLHTKPGTAPRSCRSAGEFGMVETDEDSNRIWFAPKPYYALPTGSLTYEAKGHAPEVVTWFGGRRALSRLFGTVRYHVTMGHIEVLKAAVVPATSKSTVQTASFSDTLLQPAQRTTLTTSSTTTRHAPNVQVSLVLSGWHAKEQLKFAGNYYANCQKLKPNPCGNFKDYGPTQDSVGFVPARGEKFVFGYGWRTYKFPDNPNLASCTVETWYGGKTKAHNVTACGHKHAVLYSVGASLYHS